MTDSFTGTPDTIRTYDLQYRKLTLYPAELRVPSRKNATGVILAYIASKCYILSPTGSVVTKSNVFKCHLSRST